MKNRNRDSRRNVMLHHTFGTLAIKAYKELRRGLWIFIGSFFLTPILLWLFVTVVLGHDHSFQHKFLDFYRALFSGLPDMITPLLFLLLPVLVYQVTRICFYCYQSIRGGLDRSFTSLGEMDDNIVD